MDFHHQTRKVSFLSLYDFQIEVCLTNEALVEVEFSFSYIAYASSSFTSENNLPTFSDGLKPKTTIDLQSMKVCNMFDVFYNIDRNYHKPEVLSCLDVNKEIPIEVRKIKGFTKVLYLIYLIKCSGIS